MKSSAAYPKSFTSKHSRNAAASLSTKLRDPSFGSFDKLNLQHFRLKILTMTLFTLIPTTQFRHQRSVGENFNFLRKIGRTFFTKQQKIQLMKIEQSKTYFGVLRDNKKDISRIKICFFNSTIYHQERVPQLKILDSGVHSSCSLFWVLGGHWKVDHLNVHSPNVLSVPKFYASSLFF